MSSKLYSRSGVFTWAPRGIETKGLIIADFAQFFDPNATSIEQKIDFLASNQLFEQTNLTPSASVNTNYRFNELSWSSMCSDAHPSGIFAGGTEDGTVVFFDGEKFVKEKRLEVLSARKDHHGHVLTIDVSRDARWMASGGGSGQILLWDCANLKTPFSPGTPNFQDQVKLVRWNQKNESVFASISSRRVSCWDLRRNGSPVLEFAEIPGADWSSLCWNPSDASQLIVGSQNPQVSVIQKWDSRFTSTPIKEYRHHTNGVTSIDWNKSDDRLLISSGCDGQVIIWNHETAEVIGGVGSLQNDWIRSVKWNEDEPSQFAIQYFQHPLQIGSLTSLGTPQPGTEVLAARISDQFVPAWHRAPLIGSSISLGGRLATFWKSYDPMTQKSQYNVEVETIRTEEDVGEKQIGQFLFISNDKRNLGWYLHERAYAPGTESEDGLLERTIWLILLGLQEGVSRTRMLRYLGLVEENEQEEPQHVTEHSNTVHTATTRSARSASVISEAQTEDAESAEASIVEKCSNVNWSQLDPSGWDLLLHSIRKDHGAVIRILMTSRQHVAAMMYAAQYDSDQMTAILEDYQRTEPSPHPLSSLTLAVSSGPSGTHVASASESATSLRIDQILQTYPDEKWKELLGLIVAHESNSAEIHLAAKSIGAKWLEQGKSRRACIAFVIAGDIDGLLLANTSCFSTADRVIQSMVLQKVASSSKNQYPPGMEKFLMSVANSLLRQSDAQTAWNLIKLSENGSAEMQELQWTCYQTAGGKNCLPEDPPFNPYDVKPVIQQQRQQPSYQYGGGYQQMGINGAGGGYQQQQQQQPMRIPPPPTTTNGSGPYNPAQSQAPPPPTDYHQHQRNSNLAPMPPSSTFYQTPSWDHKPPPTMPANMPPPKPAAPVTPGWNDPPPMAFKQPQTVQPKTNVMQVNWKPMDVAPAPGGMRGAAGNQQYHNVMAGVQGISLQSPPATTPSATSSAFPSPQQQAPPTTPVAPIPIQLCAEDERIMEPINTLAQHIIDSARVQAKVEKSNELRARIQAELRPRLAANRLSPETKHHLQTVAYFVSQRQIREAQAAVAQMARNAGDFVEISSFLPALKSLLSLATH